MRTVKILLISLLFSFSLAVGAEDLSFLCIAEGASGFRFENGSWHSVAFDVSEAKYILKKVKESEFGFEDKENPYGLYDFGESSTITRCSQSESGDFMCLVGTGDFFFSPSSGRFIKTYTLGYWDGVDSNDNTPHIERGRCSKI